LKIKALERRHIGLGAQHGSDQYHRQYQAVFHSLFEGRETKFGPRGWGLQRDNKRSGLRMKAPA
jgi:hypothetical protein